ncbi:MAG: cation diffusion facilitator family transporter [Gammaproteobacteria bacterium]
MGHNPTHSQIEENIPDNSQRYKETVRVTLIGSVIDLALGILKIVFGVIAQSQALIADGVHSLSDLATDAAVIYAAKHSHREADEEHPYGHGRIETVATVALGVALVAVAAGISYDALQRLFHPETLLVPGVWAIYVALLSVVSKEWIYHYTMRVAKKYKSKMLRANAWHSRSDAISSVIVVVGVAGSMAGLAYLDAIAAIIVGLMVAKIGIELVWESLKELIDTSLEAERVETIRKAILDVDGVNSLHILRTRMMGGDALVDVHIQVAPEISVSEGHFISETVRSRLIKNIDYVADVMVHIDPEDDEKFPLNTKLPLRKEITARIQQACAELEEAKSIEDIGLHYLEGKVQVDLFFPLSILHNAGPDEITALKEKFRSALSSVDEIASVDLYFK